MASASPTPSSTTSSSSVFKYDQHGSSLGTTVSTAPTVIASKLNSNNSNFDSVNETAVPNITVPLSSSNVFSSSTGPSEDVASYSKNNINTSNPSERINPFDKNNKVSDVRTPEIGSSEPVPIPETISTVEVDTTSVVSTGASSLDDLTKNRFEKYQGVQNQTTGRYVPTIPAADLEESVNTKAAIEPLPSATTYSIEKEPLTSVYSRTTSSDTTYGTATTTTTVDSAAPFKRSDAAKYSFGSAQYALSTDSVSDADIIFGDTDVIADTRSNSKSGSYSSFDRSYSTTSTGQKRSFGRDSFTTSMDVPDSIYTSKRDTTYNRSLSVTSDKDGDFSNDPRVSTSYRIYEGIQNAGFQDFDSPVKTTAPSATVTSTTSSSSSYRNVVADEDDYDLK